MLSRLTKTRNAHPDDKLTADTQIVLIEYWGTIQITIRTSTGLQFMTLLNVAYVPNFMTNTVSPGKLNTNWFHFDSWKMHLHRESETISLVERYNGHHLLENNLTSTIDVLFNKLLIDTQFGTDLIFHRLVLTSSHTKSCRFTPLAFHASRWTYLLAIPSLLSFLSFSFHLIVFLFLYLGYHILSTLTSSLLAFSLPRDWSCTGYFS